MWDFMSSEGEDIYTSAVNFQSEQLEMRYKAETPLFFHIYISDVYVYLNVSNGSVLYIDLCSWLCLHWECLPCKFEKKICIYCIGMGGVTWNPKATKFHFGQVSLLLPGKAHCGFALSSPLSRLYAAEGETQAP